MTVKNLKQPRPRIQKKRVCVYIYIYIYVILPTQPREAGASEANDHNANYATKNTNDYNAICVYTCIVCIHTYIYIYIHICT